MSTWIRVALTVALGVVLAYEFLVRWAEPRPDFAGSDFYEVGILVVMVGLPFIVGRWWVLLAISGPLALLVFWEITGHEVFADGYAPSFNIETIVGLALSWILLLIGVSIRKGFMWLTNRPDTAANLDP